MESQVSSTNQVEAVAAAASKAPLQPAEPSPVVDERMSDSGSSDATGKTKEEDDDEVSGKSPEERMTFALSCKDSGNDLFKSGDNSNAKQKYQEGLKFLKDLDLPDAKRLRIALNSNVAMCCLKSEAWSEAIAAANAVLKEEPENVKALYRRGVARSAFGFYEEAKADLLQVARLDPKNADARKELEKVKERISKHNEEKKKAFSGLFDRAAGMYADREEQMRQKRLQEEEEERRQKTIWEKEMEERKEKGEEEISFDIWKEEKKEEENKEKAKRERGEASSSSPTGRSGKSSASGATETLELDEEDQKIIDETKKMGYCYFRRNLTEEEKQLNAQHRPTKIDPPAPASPGNGSAGASSPLAAGSADAAKQSGVSSWNSKGTTYEEKDMSQWAKKRFEERLKEAKVVRGDDIDSLLRNPEQLMGALQAPGAGGDADPLASLQKLMGQFMHTEIKCKDVTGLTGDAQVVVMRGTKRFLFEFSCTVVFEVSGELKLPENGALPPLPGAPDDTHFCYKGELSLPEVSSAESKGEAWLAGSRIKMKHKVDPRNQAVVDECIDAFKKKLVEQIHHFLADFSKTA